MRFMKFLSLEVALYLYKSTIHPCVEYLYAGLLALHLLPLLNPCLIFEMQPGQVFTIGITFVDVHLNQLNLFHFLFSQGKSTHYSARLQDFLSPFLGVARMPMSTVPFPAQLDSGIFCL